MNKHTAEMLVNLSRLGITTPDALALRRIAMTLQRWFELECGDGNDHGSWTIARGRKVNGKFEYDDDGKPFEERHSYNHGRAPDTISYTRIPDREAGARKRLAEIMARYPELRAYVQTDPRGASLYILPPDREYPSGVAVFK